MIEPDYYTIGGLSPLKAFEKGLLTKEEYKGFLKGNIIKYTIRAGEKEDALSDIIKAMDYLHHLYHCLKDEELKNNDICIAVKDMQLEDQLNKIKEKISEYQKS